MFSQAVPAAEYIRIYDSWKGETYMSLHRYKIDLSSLTPKEKATLLDQIETVSYNGFFWYPDLYGGEFFVDENYSISQLKIPAHCNLIRL